MRALVLLGLVGFGVTACDSPYGTDFSKADAHNYDVTTGGHIKGASTGSSVTSTSGDALDASTHSSNAGRNTLGN